MQTYRRRERGRPPHPDVLTPAEWRVLELVRARLPNAEIAERLDLSVNTVKTHVSNMLGKLELASRDQLAAWEGEPAEVSRRALSRLPLVTPLWRWLRQGATRIASPVRVIGLAGAGIAGAVLLAVALSGLARDTGGEDSGGGLLAELPEIPALIARLIRSGDVDGLLALVALQSTPCSNSVSESPRCNPGDPSGTAYEVFPTAACQGFWTGDPRGVMESFVEGAGEPFALAELGSAPPLWDVPYGQFVLVFNPQEESRQIDARAVYLEDGRIVRAQVGCRRADQFLEPGVDEEPFRLRWMPSAS